MTLSAGNWICIILCLMVLCLLAKKVWEVFEEIKAEKVKQQKLLDEHQRWVDNRIDHMIETFKEKVVNKH